MMLAMLLTMSAANILESAILGFDGQAVGDETGDGPCMCVINPGTNFDIENHHAVFVKTNALGGEKLFKVTGLVGGWRSIEFLLPSKNTICVVTDDTAAEEPVATEELALPAEHSSKSFVYYPKPEGEGSFELQTFDCLKFNAYDNMVSMKSMCSHEIAGSTIWATFKCSSYGKILRSFHSSEATTLNAKLDFIPFSEDSIRSVSPLDIPDCNNARLLSISPVKPPPGSFIEDIDYSVFPAAASFDASTNSWVSKSVFVTKAEVGEETFGFVAVPFLSQRQIIFSCSNGELQQNFHVTLPAVYVKLEEIFIQGYPDCVLNDEPGENVNLFQVTQNTKSVLVFRGGAFHEQEHLIQQGEVSFFAPHPEIPLPANVMRLDPDQFLTFLMNMFPDSELLPLLLKFKIGSAVDAGGPLLTFFSAFGAKAVHARNMQHFVHATERNIFVIDVVFKMAPEGVLDAEKTKTLRNFGRILGYAARYSALVKAKASSLLFAPSLKSANIGLSFPQALFHFVFGGENELPVAQHKKLIIDKFKAMHSMQNDDIYEELTKNILEEFGFSPETKVTHSQFPNVDFEKLFGEHDENLVKATSRIYSAENPSFKIVADGMGEAFCAKGACTNPKVGLVSRHPFNVAHIRDSLGEFDPPNWEQFKAQVSFSALEGIQHEDMDKKLLSVLKKTVIPVSRGGEEYVEPKPELKALQEKKRNEYQYLSNFCEAMTGGRFYSKYASFKFVWNDVLENFINYHTCFANADVSSRDVDAALQSLRIDIMEGNRAYTRA